MSGLEFEENIYYEQSANPDIFLVNMVNNPAAEKCKLVGAYEFHISTENFALVDKRSKRRLYTWPFRYVRRYGKSSTNFQFEAGRKTQSGEGLFSLLTDEGDGERIFELVQTRFNQMKQRDREYKAERPSLARNGSQDGPNPALPPRQYENKDLEPATHAAPKTVTRAGPGSSRRQPPPPKPGRAPAAAAAGVAPPPKPPTQSKHPTPATKPGTSAKPSVAELNKIISNNKQALAQNGGQKVDDTYDVMGQADGAGAATYGAAYGDVYGGPAARAKLYTDDTNMYDEVNQP